MKINHNMPALNAHRLLNANSNATAKVLERLSSGKRINRAADDAAGMAISEKMDGQIRGLRVASRNALDGVSLIQTAEGALSEVHNILQRMRELSVQGANGTLGEMDRQAIQDEINQLTSEINRIGNTTEFNKQNLLRGDTANREAQIVPDSTKLEGGIINYTSATQSFKWDTGKSAEAGDTLELDLNGEKVKVTFALPDADEKAALEAYSVDTSVSPNTVSVNLDATPATEEGSAKALKIALDEVFKANTKLAGNYTATFDGLNETTITATGTYRGNAGDIKAAAYTATGTGALVSTSGLESKGTTTEVKAKKEFDFKNLKVDPVNLPPTATPEEIEAAAKAAAKKTNENIEALVGKGITINGKEIEFYNSLKGEYIGTKIGVDIRDTLDCTKNDEKISVLVNSIKNQAGPDLDGVELSQGTGIATGKIDAVNVGTASVKEVLGTTTLKVSAIALNETLTFGGVTITGKTAEAANEFKHDGTAIQTATSIAAVFNANTTFNAKYTATASGDTVTITEQATKGGSGNATAVTGSAVTNGNATAGAAMTSNAETLGIYNYKMTTGFVAGDVVTIDGQSFKAVASGADPAKCEFNIGADISAQLDSLVLAVNDPASGLSTRFTASKTGAGNDTLTLTEKATQATGVDLTDATTSIIPSLNTKLAVTAKKGGADGNDILIEDGFDLEYKVNLQIGANAHQSFTVGIGDMRASELGITGKVGDEGFSTKLNVTDGTNDVVKEAAVDVTDKKNADVAMTKFQNAINKISLLRSNLGAYQNRLEHTIANIDNTNENLTAALSRIQDTDMALSMSEYTKLNILQQSGTAMLAQANQRPQAILQLLQ